MTTTRTEKIFEWQWLFPPHLSPLLPVTVWNRFPHVWWHPWRTVGRTQGLVQLWQPGQGRSAPPDPYRALWTTGVSLLPLSKAVLSLLLPQILQCLQMMQQTVLATIQTHQTQGFPCLWFQTALNQMSLWLSFQIHSLRHSTFLGISLLFISSLCFISAFMSPSEDSKEQDSLFASCRHERYLRTKNLREVFPKKSETLDVPSFLPGGAKEAPQSLGTPSSPACDWYRRVCVLLSCPEMKQHLGHFHFPMEGKNKIKHKAQPCTGGRELFQQAGAQGHYTWGWRKQSQSCPGKGIGNHA